MSIEDVQYKRIPVEEYIRLSNDIFITLGFDKSDADKITDVLLKADLFGVESHGISRIQKYIKLISNNIVDIHANPELVFETPISAVYDAKSAMGQLVSIQAMDKAISKAKEHGIGLVQVRNSNHFGIAGYYVLKALEEGLIGICMTNTMAIMVPTFAAEALLGSNPIAFGFPSGDKPFLFDGATTVITRGKVELYKKLNKELPYEWTVDSVGEVTYTPEVVLENISEKKGGGILPVGGVGEEQAGYKGYGFAYICELLTSVLSGGVNSIHKQDKGDTSHAFYAVDPALFGNSEEIQLRAKQLADEIHSAKKAKGKPNIFIAGEKEFEREAYDREHGVVLSNESIAELNKIAEELKIKGLS